MTYDRGQVIERWYNSNKTPFAAACIAHTRANVQGKPEVASTVEDELYELWHDVIAVAKAGSDRVKLEWLVQFVRCLKERETPAQAYLFGMCMREEWNCLPLSSRAVSV